LKFIQTYFMLSITEKFVAIGDAAKALGLSITTLRRWEAEGRQVQDRTAARQRRSDLAKLKPEVFHAANSAIGLTPGEITVRRVGVSTRKPPL
jgi:hypothetical protein